MSPVRIMRIGFRGSTTDRKSTRLNSSHSQISYAVFCLKNKNNNGHGSINNDENDLLAGSADALHSRTCGPSLLNHKYIFYTHIFDALYRISFHALYDQC